MADKIMMKVDNQDVNNAENDIDILKMDKAEDDSNIG